MHIMRYITYIIRYFSENDKLPSAVNIYINNWYYTLLLKMTACFWVMIKDHRVDVGWMLTP